MFSEKIDRKFVENNSTFVLLYQNILGTNNKLKVNRNKTFH